MKNSKEAIKQARKLIRLCVSQGAFDESRVRSVVSALVSRKPRGFADILHVFARLVRLEVRKKSVLVESAVPLDPALTQSLNSKLASLHGAGLQTTYAVNPSLLAGMRIKVGSNVYDGSVSGRLTRLHENF
ncbi:MAG: F0F1 ATP synthase subunit delta [Verrucomicrobiae bacterium]|nr:F0F1 ATP synthase subunit delta [Verrucomicrobiae bacterium]